MRLGNTKMLLEALKISERKSGPIKDGKLSNLIHKIDPIHSLLNATCLCDI